jgi:methylated-DNA-[protein]-cysteine S-methyltransferase
MSEPIFIHRLASPVGTLLLISDGTALTGLSTSGHERVAPAGAIEDGSRFLRVSAQLERYFAGKLEIFDLPLDLRGTPFQQSVWKELSTIPYGTTISYRELADRLGNPRAVRAVGGANGRNPVSIIVPCHRVVGADGDLVGYGGGIDRKRWLLGHERALAPKGARRTKDYGSTTARVEAMAR